MPSPCLDAVCDALAAQSRRAVCRYVAVTDRDEVTLDEVASHVEPRVPDRGVRSRTATDSDPESRASRTRLHHVGLPKLADAGVIEYDPERRVVTEGPALSMAVDLVRSAEGVLERQQRS